MATTASITVKIEARVVAGALRELADGLKSLPERVWTTEQVRDLLTSLAESADKAGGDR